jgi:hypothetical protein
MFHVVRHLDGMAGSYSIDEHRIATSQRVVKDIKTSGFIIEAIAETLDDAKARCREIQSHDKTAIFYILSDDAILIEKVIDEDYCRELAHKNQRSEYSIGAFVTILLTALVPYGTAAMGGISWALAAILHGGFFGFWVLQVHFKINNPFEAAFIAVMFSLLIPPLVAIQNKRKSKQVEQPVNRKDASAGGATSE